MVVLNLKFIKSRLLNIKKSGSGSVLGICVICVLFSIFLSAIFLYRTTASYNYRNIDNALTDALLAGCIIDQREYEIMGNIAITESGVLSPNSGGAKTYVDQSYDFFVQSLRKNIPLTDGTDKKKEYFNFKITKYIIFNVNGNDVTAYIFNSPETSTQYTKASGLSTAASVLKQIDSSNSDVINTANGTIKTSDGFVRINKTCVYAEVEFTLNTVPAFEWLTSKDRQRTYKLARCIAITK